MAQRAFRSHILMCAGTACVSCGTFKVRERLQKELKERGLEEEVRVVITGCNGFCAEGPIMVVYPEGIFYKKLTPEDIPFLVEEHFLKGRPVEKFLYTGPAIKEKVPLLKDIPFFQHQVLRALRNRGLIDAENIDEYIAASPEEVQPILQKIRETIHNAAPDAVETISYAMPAFAQHGVLVYFAPFKHHIGFFPTGSGIAAFQGELGDYKTSKGTVQFPLDQPIPYDLIRRIVQFRMKENLEKAAAKGKKKSI